MSDLPNLSDLSDLVTPIRRKRARVEADSGAPKPPDFTSETVAVLVGKKIFHVHTAVVTSRSRFFENATKPEWRTDLTKPIDLSDEDPILFAKYCQWLYSDKLPPSDIDTYKAKYAYFIGMFLLGELLMDETIRDAAIDAMIYHRRTSNKLPSYRNIMTIYHGTTAGSPAHRLFVDFWAFSMKSDWPEVTRLSQDIYRDFMQDLFYALIKYRCRPGDKKLEVSEPWIVNPRSYQLADTKEQKSKDKK